MHAHRTLGVGKSQKLFLFFFLLSYCFLGEEIASSTQKKDSFHLCYFSLNNEKEYAVIQDIIKKIASKSQQKILVKEYLPYGSIPNEAFKKMLESAHCDGLVLSGHHTGSFGGKRGDGSLSIDFLEDLVCENQDAKNWFSSIKSLWLQGCRTLGSGEITNFDNLANFHTARVGALIEEDGLETNLSALNQEFSNVLDESNPLSHRYRKLFPKAQIFGWTKTAPGEKSKSEYSIPYHFAQLMKLNNDNKTFPVSILQDEHYSSNEVIHFEKVFDQLLKPEASNNSTLSVLAWENHGRGGPYAFYNTDLDAYPPLMQEDSKTPNLLLLSHKLSCKLRKKETNTVMEALDTILSSPRLIAYNLKDIVKVIKNSNSNRSHISNKILNKLRLNQAFQDFLAQRLQSERIGLLRKLDYLLLMKTIYNSNEKAIDLIANFESQIYESIKDILHGNGYENVDLNYMTSYKRDLLYTLKDIKYNKNKLIEVLHVALEDNSPVIHASVIKIAGDLKDERLLSIIENGLEMASELMRSRSIASIINFYEGRERLIIPIILDALQDPSHFVRESAVQGLSKVGLLLEKELLWEIINKGLEDTNHFVGIYSLQFAAFIAEKINHNELLYTEAEINTLIWPTFQRAFNSNNPVIMKQAITSLRINFLKEALLMLQNTLKNNQRINLTIPPKELAGLLVAKASCSKLKSILNSISISEESIKTAISSKCS